MKTFRLRFVLLFGGCSLGVVALALFAAAPPPPSAPGFDPVSPAELGRLLFWDPLLSGGKDVACATCHHPDFAYADGRALALGSRATGLGPARMDASRGEIPVVKRNTPTILNVVFNGLDRRGRGGPGGGPGGGGRGGRGGGFTVLPASLTAVDQARAPMFWDNRLHGLEAQALAPLAAREEMRGDVYGADDTITAVVERLRGVPEYVALFRGVYGEDTAIDAAQLSGAIAAFERTLVTRGSAFDRYLAGDQAALTPEQRRGLDAFTRANCTACHRGPMLSDFQLHALGVKENPLLAAPDAGDGRFQFRTPSLRNVALTAPYMHNGMLATLADVVAFYDRGQSENPHVATGGNGPGGRGGRGGPGVAPAGTPVVDPAFRGVRRMSAAERNDIVAFLGALTDEGFDRVIPARVPSGLKPGGEIGKSAVAAQRGR
jgi:cytochrome c peroxidase